MTNATVLPSRNTDYGFFGTLTTCPERDRRTSEVWILTSRLIAQAVNATSEEEMIGIRDFLDSRSGRHFADEVVGALQCGAPDCEAAIAAAIAKWQDWRIAPGFRMRARAMFRSWPIRFQIAVTKRTLIGSTNLSTETAQSMNAIASI